MPCNCNTYNTHQNNELKLALAREKEALARILCFLYEYQ